MSISHAAYFDGCRKISAGKIFWTRRELSEKTSGKVQPCRWAMAHTILQLYKILARTNCGDCGEPACMAFAAKVIADGENLGKCPHLSREAQEVSEELKKWRKEQGKRPDAATIALAYMQEKVAFLDFASLAVGLGATYGEEKGRPYLSLSFFTHELQVFKDEVHYPAGAAVSPWNSVLIYNYIASQGNVLPTGKWITFASLPNSVAKAKTIDQLEEKVAAYFSCRTDLLGKQIEKAGGRAADAEGNATVKALFRPLPQIPVLMLVWDDKAEEDFGARCHFLFDSTVMKYLDLESLLFLVEGLVDRLLQD